MRQSYFLRQLVVGNSINIYGDLKGVLLDTLN